MTKLDFFKTALKDYRVAAVLPSSKYTVRGVLGALGSHPRYIVEYGAGDGIITERLLRTLPPDGRIVAIELQPRFIPQLKAIRDPRLTVVEGNVAELSGRLASLGLPRVDAVVSGIPFSFFSPATRRAVVERTHRALAPGGVFVVYQHSPLLLPYLKAVFREVKLSFEPRNLPPYFIMTART